MRRLTAALFILWFGLALTTGTSDISQICNSKFSMAQAESQGPTIEWPGPEANNSATIAWDGIYNGQTEQGWALQAWINDTDGIDTVIFMFKGFTETDWTNLTPTLIDGNDTVGLYQYNYTYAVWWNYTIGYPETEGTGGSFTYKIFANDTLGYSTETGNLTYSGGFMEIIPPLDAVFYGTILPALIGIGAIVVVISIVLIVRKRGM